MKQFYNKLSDEYNKLYIQNIIEFQMRMRELTKENKSYVDFYPSFGIKENEKTDFIIYGQAVNGWSSGFKIYDTIDDEKIIESIHSSNSYLKEKGHNPLDWVNIQWKNSIYNDECQDESIKEFYKGNYRTSRSLFWQVAYKLISDYYSLNRSSYDWSNKLVWSNLYKIAPDGANPNWEEKESQLLSYDLVKREIEELSPKFCIVFTNLKWWNSFGEYLQTIKIEKEKTDSVVESIEEYKNTKIIVLKRPPFGNSDEFVKEILKVLN